MYKFVLKHVHKEAARNTNLDRQASEVDSGSMQLFKPTRKRVISAVILTLFLYPLNAIPCQLTPKTCPVFIPVSLLLNPLAGIWGLDIPLDFSDPFFYANLFVGFLIFYPIVCIFT